MNINDIPIKAQGDELSAEEFNAVVDQVKENIEPIFEEPTITSTSLGMLSAGSNISGLNALEVLDRAINAELFPTLTNPSHGFTISPAAAFQEVGSTHNILLTGTFNRGSINPQYQSESPHRSGPLDFFEMWGSGMVDPVDTTSTHQVNNYSIVYGANSWSMISQYSEGVQPKGSKGTNFQSPLPNGSLPPIVRSITGVYPIFATSVSAGTNTKQALQSHTTDVTVNMAAESSAKQVLLIPQIHNNITGLQQYNTLSGQWDNIDLGSFSKTSVVINVNGTDINYFKYEHNGASIGARQLKFKV